MEVLNAFTWLMNIIRSASSLWNTLSVPLFELGDLDVSLLGLLTWASLTIVLGMKLVKLLPLA